MTEKDFLLRAWHIDARIECKLEERARLRELLSAGMAGEQGGEDCDFGKAREAVASLDAEIEAEIVDLCRVKREISDAIGAVEDARLRRLLELRYRNYMTWESIADELGYELRHVYRLRKKALNCVGQVVQAHGDGCEISAESPAIEGQRTGATL